MSISVNGSGITKAGVTPVPVDSYVVSAAEVIRYLENDVLGFKIAADIKRWRGVSDAYSYVRMRCVFAKKDLVIDNKASTFVDRVLEQDGCNAQFKDNVIKSLEQFMYPTRQNMMRTPMETLHLLQMRGVYGNRLEELINYCELKFNKEKGVFMIYLRPEAIITDMLKDPATNKIDGNMSIIGVTGEDESDLKWFIEVRKSADMGLDNISIDNIFAK